jgi:Amt family ammonium transporter
MKNLMDFCLGVPMFMFIGFGLLLGEDYMGIIGKPGFDLFTNYANFSTSDFVFNMVFCATTSTIVSGAMAERTKFLSYCVYSAIISGFIYPIEAHWIWGGGWLSQLGFHDFAGSCAIHMVGGISALIGAKILGPRIGKFTTDKDGKVTKVNAIPGHSLTLGALGCFILWFGWYGFNGAAATSGAQLGSIFLTTTIAPAVATVVCMVFTWLKYGKPDVSMCLNASLAGLVGITAGCDVMDAFGAIMVGFVSGFLVVFGVWLLDNVLHIDDPVGAVAVHMMNGLWGTFAVGLFATTSAPESEIAGLFYGGGVTLLGTQCLGIISVAAWTAVTITIVFLVIKSTIGLRASVEEETRGLDITEHGLASSYADFMPTINTNAFSVFTGETTQPAAGKKAVSSDEAVPVQVVTSSKNVVASDVKLSKIDIICKLGKFDDLKTALNNVGVTGITVSNVSGCGVQKGETAPRYRGAVVDMTLLPKIRVEVVVSTVPVATVVAAAKQALYTGNIGDGKIFVYDVENVIKVRTGEEGMAALQGSDD